MRKKKLFIIILIFSVVILTLKTSTLGMDISGAVDGVTNGNWKMNQEQEGILRVELLKAFKYIRGIAVAVALICILILGIKTIVGSPEEKTETKKAILPFVIGAVIIVFATTIVAALIDIINKF